VAYIKGWVNENLRTQCKACLEIMLARYPDPENWWHVRFSDEVHFGLGLMGKLMIIRKPGERYYLSYIQEQDKPDQNTIEAKKVHA
jgi:hypothetical protein